MPDKQTWGAQKAPRPGGIQKLSTSRDRVEVVKDGNHVASVTLIPPATITATAEGTVTSKPGPVLDPLQLLSAPPQGCDDPILQTRTNLPDVTRRARPGAGTSAQRRLPPRARG